MRFPVRAPESESVSGRSSAAGGSGTAAEMAPFRITEDGSWLYHGSPIHRKPLISLFSSVLVREEGGGYALVTPVERVAVDVDDVPFIVMTMEIDREGGDQVIRFETNVGDRVTLDGDHPLRVTEDSSGPRPYVTIRPGIEARIARSVYYELVEHALGVEPPPGEQPGVRSAGLFFPLEPVPTPMPEQDGPCT